MYRLTQHFKVLNQSAKFCAAVTVATLFLISTASAIPVLTPDLTSFTGGAPQKVTVKLALKRNESTPYTYRFLAGFESTDFLDSLHSTAKLRGDESGELPYTYKDGPKKLEFILKAYYSEVKSRPKLNISPECDIRATLTCEPSVFFAETTCRMNVGQTNPNSNPEINFTVTRDASVQKPTFDVNCKEKGFS